MAGLKLAGLALAFTLAAFASPRRAPPLKIGVLTDASGPYVDSGGPGSVVAAEMAAKDFGGEVLGRKIEILLGDTLNKPDVAVGVARRWFDVEGVSAITDLARDPRRLLSAGAGEGKEPHGADHRRRDHRHHRQILRARLLALGRRYLCDGDFDRQSRNRRRRQNLVLPHRRHRFRRGAAEDHDGGGREGRRQAAWAASNIRSMRPTSRLSCCRRSRPAPTGSRSPASAPISTIRSNKAPNSASAETASRRWSAS